MKVINPWLKPFCGNDPLCDGELGGHTIYRKSTTEDFPSPSKHKKLLDDFVMQVQHAVNVRKENEECHTPTDEVERKGCV